MPVTIAQFLQSLGENGLLSKEDRAKVEQAWPAERRGEDAKPLAAELVRQKLLTQFQALNLYHGKAQFLVLGNYLLLDALGEGGMGKVYKAVHRRMKRTVAVKLLPAALTKQTEALRRFQREVQAAAQLVHPNIVTAYDADEARGVYFLVMEYVDGQDLGSYLKEHGVLPVALAVDCIIQAARGLEYAHAKGVIHRDIKPSNLLLGRDGVVKVMDMGLARFDDPVASAPPPGGSASSGPGEDKASSGDAPTADVSAAKTPAASSGRERTELTRQGQVIGTVAYMAPEQTVEMGSADARSDIYALGCTLYRLLTGDVPYPRDSIVATMEAHRQAPIPTLRKFRRDTTPELDAVVRRMLAKEPSERFQSMHDVIAALKELTVDGGPAQHVSQKAAGDDFQSDLLSSLMGLGPGALSADWNPADHARHNTAAHSQTVAAQTPAPVPPRPVTMAQPPERSFPWLLVGVVGALVLVSVMLFFLLRTGPANSDGVVANKQPDSPPKTGPIEPAKTSNPLEIPKQGPPNVTTGPATGPSPAVLKEIFSLEGHTGATINLALAADAGLLLSGGKDGKLMLWDLRARKRLKEFDARTPGVRTVAITKDGRRGASGGHKTPACYWDLENGKLLHEFEAHGDWVAGVALSPGGTLMASAGFDADLRIFSLENNQKLQDFQCQELASTWARGVDFSPDGSRVATCGNDAHAAVWNVDTAERLYRVGPHKQPVNKVKFSPNGRFLLTGGFDHRLVLWNLESGRGTEFAGHTGSISGIAFLPDARHILSASQDGTAQMWDVASGQPVCRFAEGTGWVYDIVATPDGRYAIASADDLKVHVYRLPLEVGAEVPDFLAPRP